MNQQAPIYDSVVSHMLFSPESTRTPWELTPRSREVLAHEANTRVRTHHAGRRRAAALEDYGDWR